MIRTTLFAAALTLVSTLGLAAATAGEHETAANPRQVASSVPSAGAQPAPAREKPTSEALPYFTSHAIEGYVFRAQVPASWRVRAAQKGSITVASPKAEDGSYLTAHFRVYAPFGGTDDFDMTPQELREMFMKLSQPHPKAEKVNAFGRAFDELRTLGRLARWKQPSGVMHAAHMYVGISPKQQTVYVEVQGHGDAAAKRVISEGPVVEALLDSLTITKAAKVTDAVRAEMPSVFVPNAARVSARRDYHVDITPSLYVPKGWQAVELSRIEAGRGRERGEYAIQLVPPGGVLTPDGPQTVLVLLEGLPVGPVTRAQFLASLDKGLSKFGDHATRTSQTTIQHPGLRYFASLATRRGDSTQATYVRSYEMKGRRGNAMRMKTYTAGGMTAVTHVFVIGPASRFEALESAAQPIVDSYRVFLKSPSIR